MSVYSPDVHTPTALAEEIDFVTHEYPNALIVGSIGRGGVYNALLSDAEHEYRLRHQQPTQTFRGGVADLDIINAPLELEGSLSPFDGDLRSLFSKQVKLSLVDGVWHLSSENRGFDAELDERVMEPISTQTVYGVLCHTLSPQTHLRLLGITGTIRKQDEIANDVLSRAIQESGETQLPGTLYEPFDELFELNYGSAMATARRTYRTILPIGIRRVLAPTMQKIKDRHLR